LLYKLLIFLFFLIDSIILPFYQRAYFLFLIFNLYIKSVDFFLKIFILLNNCPIFLSFLLNLLYVFLQTFDVLVKFLHNII